MPKIKQENKIITTTIDMRTAALMDEKVHKMHATRSALVREAIREYIEDGVNTPILTLSVVNLIAEIERLKGTIPKENYETLQDSVQNIINSMGGESDGTD